MFKNLRYVKWPASIAVLGKSFVDWWDTWIDFVLISAVWLIAQFTIILGPPTTFGIFYVVNVMVREGDSTGLRGMFRGTKLYFGKALIWGLINLFVVFLIYTSIRFYSQFDNFWGSLATWLVVLLAIGYSMAQFYTVPFFMQMKDDYKKVLVSIRNGFFLGMASPFFTLILMIFCIIVGGLSAVVIIPLFLGVPALIAMISTRAMVNRLEHFNFLKKDPDPREVL